MVTDFDLQGIDILDYLTGTYKKVAGTHNGEYAGSCPFCGGEDRFRVWPNHPDGKGRFWCRQCDLSGDVLTLIQQLHNCGFKHALDYLRIAPAPQRQSRPQQRQRQPSRNMPDNERWQARARAFIAYCGQVWEGQNEDQRRILKRGIGRGTAMALHIVYNPSDIRDSSWPHPEPEKTVYLPAGIVIPKFDSQRRIRAIKIRTPDGQYRHVAGSQGILYRGHAIQPGCTVILTESELDAAMLVSQIATFRPAWFDTVIPVALPARTTYGAALVMRLTLARRVVVAMDNDSQGQAAAAWWLKKLPGRARLLIPPDVKDIGDMYQGGYNILRWLDPLIEGKPRPDAHTDPLIAEALVLGGVIRKPEESINAPPPAGRQNQANDKPPDRIFTDIFEWRERDAT